SLPTQAAEEAISRLSADFLVELQYDAPLHSQDSDHEQRDLYTTVESSLGLALAGPFSLHTNLVLESVSDPRGTGSRYFDDQGLYAEQIFIAYETETLFWKVGKINPAFGIAWGHTPGVYGVDFAEDYEITEKIGLELELPIKLSEQMQLRWTAAAFFADTTLFSESVINHRYYDEARTKERNRKSLGGLTNTEKLDSFTTTLTGENLLGRERCFWNLGFSHFENPDASADQQSVLAAAHCPFELREGLELDLFAEGVLQDNAEGVDDDKGNYLTTSASLAWGNWRTALAQTQRNLKPKHGSDSRNRLYQVSVGYEFESGIGAEIAYLRTREDRVHTNGFGFLVYYEFGL
ncbi:MAG: hypothetical protein JRC77_05250, partial [Deltaproteobacteria bacterium]|nr:hypothetical protein [Deltaproteobacteria bacterium]